MSDSKRREHICFTGYVQGVGFRYRLSHLAQYYGVTGWVRNTSSKTMTTSSASNHKEQPEKSLML